MHRLKYIAVAIVAFVSITGTALAYTSPGKPVGYVNDFAKILTSDQAATLETKLTTFEQQTGAEVSIATISDLGGDSVDNFAVELFQEWGIGKKGADNGWLILVAPNDQEARIEVGYGLEPTVTDALSSVILNHDMLSAFKTGDYYGGLDKATSDIIGLINNDPSIVKTVSDQVGQYSQGSQSSSQPVPLFVPIIIFVIFIILVSTRWGRRVLFYMFLSNAFRGGRNGGGGFGGGGGGFGGFGGGGSGGGGASGKW